MPDDSKHQLNGRFLDLKNFGDVSPIEMKNGYREHMFTITANSLNIGR